MGFDIPRLEEVSEVVYTGQMIEAEYALGLQAVQTRSRAGSSKGSNLIGPAWINTRQTRRNDLPDTSSTDRMSFSPAGSLVKTISNVPSEQKKRRSRMKGVMSLRRESARQMKQ